MGSRAPQPAVFLIRDVGWRCAKIAVQPGARVVLSHPSRKSAAADGLDGAEPIKREPAVKALAGPRAQKVLRPPTPPETVFSPLPSNPASALPSNQMKECAP